MKRLSGINSYCAVGIVAALVALPLLATTMAADSAAGEIRAVNLAGLSGTYVLTVDGDRVTVTPLKMYGLTPTPDPNPIPPPDPLTARARAARDASLKATADQERTKTAQILAVLYAELANRIRTGALKGQTQIAAFAKTSADVVLDQRKVAEPWKPFRESLSAEWTKLLQEGGTDQDFATLLEEVSDGLSASVPAPEALDLQQIIQLIMVILEIVQKLFPQ